MGMLGQPSAAFLTHLLFLTFAFDFGTLASCLSMTRVSMMLVLGGDLAANRRKERELWGLGAVVGKHTRWEPHPTATVGAGSQHWPKDTADLRWKVPEPPNPFELPGPGQRKMEVHSTTGALQWGWDKGDSALRGSGEGFVPSQDGSPHSLP